MRQWISLVVMGSFLLSLAGCAQDSMKAPSEPAPVAPTIAQAPTEPPTLPSREDPSAEQSSEEVQERAVGPALSLKTPTDTKVPPLLPGHFAFKTFYGYWVTALGGGGRTSDAFRTTAKQVQAWEKFRLMPLGYQHYAIVTPTGHLVTAVDGGNRIAEPVLQSTRTAATNSEWFLLFMDYNSGGRNIRTISTKYLTAVGGGGKTTNPFHTDAVKADRWEWFGLYKCGDLGSGYQYAIVNPSGGPLRARDGGGHTTADAISVSGYLSAPPRQPYDDWARFRLIRQNDGSYALQTSKGYYVTAVNGGGVVMGPKTPVVLQTDRTQVGDWEKFRIVDFGDCTYTIQTLSGWYFDASKYSTGRSDINYATKFSLFMFGLDPYGR